MNPLAWIMGNLRLAVCLAGLLALLGAFWWLSDLVGDSRELDVREAISKQEDKTNEAAETGRARARACHARGPDWLWNVAKAECERTGPAVPQSR